MVPLSSACVGVGPALLLGNLAARSNVAKTELVNGTSEVDVSVMTVSGWLVI